MSSLDRAGARQRFCVARVAVLGTVTEAGQPHLVPVTFVLADDVVAFAVDHKPKSTTNLRRLANISRCPDVSFLVDEYADDWSLLWWVRVDAVAEILTSGTRHQRLLDALAEKYPQYRTTRPTGPVVAAQVSSIVGWSASKALERPSLG
ncbi:MAG: TIGR03668 family PPOX class F420-dependent oxidoreductase [Actinomycetota bacterium]|nr:TIGR03668 family PPOX class F420-dependent oxidoreductase [Actinomycetota bacterium]